MTYSIENHPPAPLSRRRLLRLMLAGSAAGLSCPSRPWAKDDEPPHDIPAGYKLEIRHPLKTRTHGRSGHLALLVDQRITALSRPAMEEYYFFGYTEDTEVAKTMDAQALAEAQMVIHDDDGKTVETIFLGTPFARLRAVALTSSAPHEFVIETSQGGFGQFTGTYGRVFTIEQGAIRYSTAIDDETNAPEDMVLQRSPGTDWRIIPASGRGSDIYQVICRSDETDGTGFGEVYVSYRLDKTGWHKRRRMGQGFCTWTDGFPVLRAFP
ncbi:MAG: hypothetical protein H7840_06840 [Alphaproteobacteria bacterium]